MTHNLGVPEAIPLPGLNLRRLWKVTIVDNPNRPTKQIHLLVRKCETAFQAMNDVKKTHGYEVFVREYPSAQIFGVEMAGILEN